jgi:DNA-binding CsgD family transcriptional regulator
MLVHQCFTPGVPLSRDGSPPAATQGPASTGLIPGSKIFNRRDFVRERFGATAWDAVLARLSPEDQELVASVDPGAWYDVHLVERLINTACQQLKLDDGLLMEMGRFDADRELSTVYRWFLRLIRPSFAIRHMNLYWRRSHDTGTWRSSQNGPEVTAELRDWAVINRAMCITLLGYLGRTLELFGGKLASLEHTECRSEGHATCIFRTHLELPADEPRPGRRPTRADISSLARELAHSPNREALVEALVTLLRFQFGCSWVEVWVTGQDDRMQLMGVSGERGPGDQRRFVLEVAGRSVGRLELELPRGPGQRGVDEVLSDLMPWVAIALETARGARGEPQRVEESELARRLRRAREIGQLTPRQVEVLELVARGKTNKEIAAVLGRSEGTVEVHVTNLLRKYGASNRAGLVAMFWGEL